MEEKERESENRCPRHCRHLEERECNSKHCFNIITCIIILLSSLLPCLRSFSPSVKFSIFVYYVSFPLQSLFLVHSFILQLIKFKFYYFFIYFNINIYFIVLGWCRWSLSLVVICLLLSILLLLVAECKPLSFSPLLFFHLYPNFPSLGFEFFFYLFLTLFPSMDDQLVM